MIVIVIMGNVKDQDMLVEMRVDKTRSDMT